MVVRRPRMFVFPPLHVHPPRVIQFGPEIRCCRPLLRACHIEPSPSPAGSTNGQLERHEWRPPLTACFGAFESLWA